MENCKLCNEKTDTSFNINLGKIPICEWCAKSIFMQQARWYTDTAPCKSQEIKEAEKTAHNKRSKPLPTFSAFESFLIMNKGLTKQDVYDYLTGNGEHSS